MSIEFSSKTDTYYEFSNFYLSKMIIDDIEWKSVEHYFQAQKFPTDKILQDKIKNASSPTVAKKLGRTKTEHFRNDWEEVKEQIILVGLRSKFNQNKELKEMLIKTQNLVLKEKSWWDSYWGTGRNGKGKNRMGYLLSIVRNELQEIK